MMDLIPIPYCLLLPHLLHHNLVEIREFVPPPTPLPLGYNADARCETNSGAPGKSIENCRALKNNMQDLIDSKAIIFTVGDLRTN